MLRMAISGLVAEGLSEKAEASQAQRQEHCQIPVPEAAGYTKAATGMAVAAVALAP
jgi:hypothetical protein